jgi:hypothetical protein
MASPCSTTSNCCPLVYVTFVPQVAGSIVPQQVPWVSHTPMIPTVSVGGVDAALGLGAPLQFSSDAMNAFGLQGQAFWQAVEPMPAHCKEDEFAPPQFAMTGGTGSTNQEYMSPEAEIPVTASSELIDTTADSPVRGVSQSMLRRRRRQRAAMRAPTAGADEGAAEGFRSEERGEGSAEEDVEHLVKVLLEQMQGSSNDARQGAARFRRLAFADKTSSRAAQMALEEAQGTDAAALVSGMHGHVRAALKSMFANYVIQKIVEVMPWTSARFIPEELLGAGQQIARHRFGCRILCRLLEHGPLSDCGLAALLEEVLVDTAALSSHEFGNYVVRHSLEFGLPEHRRWVAWALCADGNLTATACHQFGSRVMETALQFCGPEEQHMLAAELLGSKERVIALATSVAGRHVVKVLMAVAGGIYREHIVELLRPAVNELRESAYGGLVLGMIGEVRA